MTILVASSNDNFSTLPVGHLLLWCGLVLLTVVLIVLVVTRWGRTRPLHTCAVLSLLAHVLLACLATIVRLVSGIGEVAEGPPIRVRLIQESLELPSDPSRPPEIDETADRLVESPESGGEISKPEPSSVEQPSPADNNGEVATTPVTTAKSDPTQVSRLQERISSQPIAVKQVATDLTADTEPAKVEPKSLPVATNQELAGSGGNNALSLKAKVSIQSHIFEQPWVEPAPQNSVPVMTISDVPRPYANRRQPDRLGFVERQGGSRETEAAVRAALAWLAAIQSQDGRWKAGRFDAGQEQAVLGHHRGNAGIRADTGVSGLALLAYLGAGYTHLAGEYTTTVRDGLQFLIDSQSGDGNLCGEATPYARMYCHSMASFAMAEALAISGDARLRPSVLRAVRYAVEAQNSSSGGWRYRPGQSGDTSQLGWQLMALHSAELAGVPIPPATWTTVERFMRSVARGQSGGLASYRPDGPPSRTMTAEALYCRQLLSEAVGGNLNPRLQSQASQFLTEQLPGQADFNLYYWYYATLALHHQQYASAESRSAWDVWNKAMRFALLAAQVDRGPNAGSWPPNTVWGGYGGRVYSTALATMCLEVYYRYAPSEPARNDWIASEPAVQPISR